MKRLIAFLLALAIILSSCTAEQPITETIYAEEAHFTEILANDITLQGLTLSDYFLLEYDQTCRAYVPLWKCWGNANASTFLSYGVNPNKFTPTNSPVWTQQGWTLNGSNQVISAPSAPNLNFTGAVTLEAWIKTSKTTNYGIVLDKTDGALYGWSMTLASGIPVFSSGTAGYGDNYYADVSVADNEWHEIIMSWDGSTKYIMVDGIVVKTKSFTANFGVGTQELWIGGRQGLGLDGTYLHSGTVGECAVWSRGLTPTQGLAHYNATKWRYE